MSTLELIIDRAKALPPEKQREVLDFVKFIRSRLPPGSLCATEEEPEEATPAHNKGEQEPA